MGRRSSVLVLFGVIVAFALAWRLGFYTAPGSSDVNGTSELVSAASKGKAEPSDASAKKASRAPQPPAGASAPTKAAAPAATSDAGLLPAPLAGKETVASADPAKPNVGSATPPSFDIVRVEPDGSAVIAGRAAPNQTVSVMNGTVSVGETRSNANGEFALDLSLPAGEHRLRLAQADGRESQTSLSNEAAIVSVPQRGQPSELLVMMERPGQASEVLVRPTPADSAVASQSSATVAAAESSPSARTEQVLSEPPIAAPRSDLQVASVDPKQPTGANPPAKPDGEAARTRIAAPKAAGALAVEAVEIENGKLFVAGAANSQSSVRIYLDGIFVTEATGGAGDRFIASAMTDVPVGNHMIRADELGADGRVISRVEVPFNRPDMSSMAAVASARTPAQMSGTSSPSERSLSPANLALGDREAASELPADEQSEQAVAAASPADGQASGRVNAPSLSQTDLVRRLDDSEDLQASSQVGVVEPDLAAVVQAPLEAAQSRVIIRRGDTLWRISRQTYGRGSRYTVIYLANGDQIRDPNRIYPGQVFRMPDDEAGSAPRG